MRIKNIEITPRFYVVCGVAFICLLATVIIVKLSRKPLTPYERAVRNYRTSVAGFTQFYKSVNGETFFEQSKDRLYALHEEFRALPEPRTSRDRRLHEVAMRLDKRLPDVEEIYGKYILRIAVTGRGKVNDAVLLSPEFDRLCQWQTAIESLLDAM